MNLVLLGVNHRSAAVEVRERMHFASEELAGALARLRGDTAIEEAYLLSTCNRTEVLLASGDPGAGVEAVRGFLRRERHFSDEELDRHLYVHHDDEAVRHLFRLGVGLDSMILGEPQILGQVKDGYRAAQEAGALGPLLDGLLQRAFSVAKKIRSSTQIGRNPVSISFAAVELAHKIFGGLEDKSILIMGAGKTAELTARHLVTGGVRRIYVANRTYNRAVELARAFDGEAIRHERFKETLEEVDILISSTSAPHFILRHEEAVEIIRRRRNRPLFALDIAVPRDIDPAINRIDNIYLYDIDDLRHVADSGLEKRREAAAEAEEMIGAEVAAFAAWQRSRAIEPTIIALRERLHVVRQLELERFNGRLKDLDDGQRRTVEELTAALINKVLHQPIRTLKREAASPNGAGTLHLIRTIFGLGRAPSASGGAAPPSNVPAPRKKDA